MNGTNCNALGMEVKRGGGGVGQEGLTMVRRVTTEDEGMTMDRVYIGGEGPGRGGCRRRSRLAFTEIAQERGLIEFCLEPGPYRLSMRWMRVAMPLPPPRASPFAHPRFLYIISIITTTPTRPPYEL